MGARIWATVDELWALVFGGGLIRGGSHGYEMIKWFPRRDSNPHAYRHQILILKCLAIPPLGILGLCSNIIQFLELVKSGFCPETLAEVILCITIGPNDNLLFSFF